MSRSVPLDDIVRYLDELLRTAEIPDYPNAINGLQLENSGTVTRIAAAVDAREQSISAAVAEGADLMLVHHGLFWGGLQPVRGAQRRRLHALLSGNIALYSSHLPLDANAELGNNVLLARELGLTPSEGFARDKQIDIGVAGRDEIPTRDLIEKADAFARQWGGSLRHTPYDAGRITRRWGICTGAGASTATIREAHARGIDTLIAGEGAHHTAIDADELGVCVLYAGHYATETLGVRALAQRVSEVFSLPWSFVHVPTGL
jgi:dinuclear metal center YbgI/SA1388 family protein